MRETAHILRYATARSLIVLDEIGRGTSTYDGVSIAWAVAEHLHDRVRAKTLFATHYHELCALADLHPRVRNVSVAAREWKGEVVFLRKLSPGRRQPVVRDRGRQAGGPAAGGGRSGAFDPEDAGRSDAAGPRAGRGAPPASPCRPIAEVVAALRSVDPDDLSPRAALDLLAALRKKLTPP